MSVGGMESFPCAACCGGGTVTSCCPDDALPAQLTATVTSAGILNGSYILDQFSESTWRYVAEVWGTCPVILSPRITLTCGLAGWNLTVSGNPTPYSPSTVLCSPLFVTFVNVDTSACGGTANSEVVVTL